MDRKEHSLIGRYLVALLAPAAMVGVMQLVSPLFQGSPVAMFLLAIMFSAWYGGFRPGLLSTLASLLLADYFFLPPLFSLGPANRTDVIRLLVMTAVGACCSALSGQARRATRRAESILSGVVDVHLLLDRQWRYVYANDAAIRAIGRSREQILGRTLWELYPDTVGTELDRQYRRAMNEGVPVSFDFYYATTDTWWSNRFLPAPEGLAVFATDITERKRSEEKLREHEKVVEGLDEMIVVVDREYRYLLANRAFLKYRGLNRDQVVGHFIPEFLGHEVFEGLVKTKLDECFQGKVVKDELSYFYPGLGERDLLASYFPIEGRDGVDRAVCILKDITEQRAAEEMLWQSERQLVEAQHIAHVGSWYWDLKTNDGSWSEELYRIFGLSPDEPAPSYETALAKLVHPDDLDIFQSAVDASLASGEPCDVTYRIIRADGAERIIHSRGNVEIDDDGNPVRMFGTAQDVTERRQAEKSLASRARQQAVVAQLGQMALSGADLYQLFDRAVARVAETFGVEYCKVLELLPEGNALKLVAGAGWKPGLIGQATVGTDRDSQAGFTLLSREPVIVEDLRTETRFHGPALLRDHGVISGLSVIIGKFERAFGVMGAHSTSPRTFTTDDVNFLQSVAHVLAEAIERMRGEEALTKAERKYRDIFENAGEGIFQTTLDGQYISANPALARMHGFATPEELIRARNDIANQIYDDPQKRMEFRRLLEQHGTVRGFEHQIFRKDGSKIWISVNARAVRDEQGKVLYYEGISQDITERKRAGARSEAFATLARKLSGARTQIEAGQIIADMARQLFGWDSCNLDLYDADRDEIRAMLNIDTIDGKQVDVTALISNRRPTARSRRVIEHGSELVLREEPVTFEPDAIPFGDRTRPSASIMTVPIRHLSRVIGLLSIQSYRLRAYDQLALADLEALADHCGAALNRIRAEESLYESEERFRQLAENLEDVIWITDRNITEVLYINAAYERIFGRSRESLYQKLESFLDAVHPDDRESVQGILDQERNGNYSSFEYRIIRPDGTVRWIHRRTFPIRNDEGEVHRIAGIGQDITERNRAQEGLRESEERYRDLVENSREFICTHDLDGLILTANRAAADMLGYDLSDYCRKKNFRDLLAPEVRDQFDDYLVRIRRDGVASGLTLVQTSSGERRVWEYHNTLRTEGVVTPIVRGMARDITEERRAQQALHESEERFSKAFHSSPAPLIITRLADGQLLNANDSFLRAFGYERDEVIGKTVGDLNLYVDSQEREKLIEELRKRGALRGYESRARTKSGQILDLLVSVEPVKLNGTECILATAYDITEQKSIEEALRESEERYRELFENAKDALYVHDLSGRYTSFNRAAEELSGFSRDEILGKHFSNFISPAHLKYTRENLCKKLDYEGETTYEVDLVTKDRKRVPIEISSRLIFENGTPVGVQGVARDITERKRAEEAHARFALIVESSDDAIIGKNLDGTILSWNPGAEKIYGYSAREVIGCHISILVPPDRKDEIPAILESIRSGKGIRHHESVRRRKDGKLIDVSLTVSPIRDAQNKIVGASTIARDVTERKQTAQIFSRRLIAAQEAERQHIARELHDEIGQVLTAVRINLLSLGRAAPSDPAVPIDDSLAIVDEALDRVRELSLNLRPPVLDNLGLGSALRWYVDRYARRSGIVADLQTDLNGRRLRVDLETACFRITQEALTNIARHAQATHVLVRLKCTNGNLDLKIIDNGVGFDVGALIKDSHSALGLRGMEERAVAARGHLKIDSAPTRGTEVRASFPLKDGA